MHKKNKIHKKCLLCGTIFAVLPSRVKKKFCSVSCSQMANRPPSQKGKTFAQRAEKKCPTCRKTFVYLPSRESAYCSSECYYKSSFFHDLMVQNNTGRVVSLETRKKIAASHRRKGHQPPVTKGRIPWNKGKRNPLVTGDRSPSWKGKEAKYHTKHTWANYWFGKPNRCEHCGSCERKMYHWANISGEYKRERSDWVRLCVPCHKFFDKGAKLTLEQAEEVRLRFKNGEQGKRLAIEFGVVPSVISEIIHFKSQCYVRKNT